MSAAALILVATAGGLATAGEAAAAEAQSAAAVSTAVMEKTNELIAAPMGDFQRARKARVWESKGIDWSSDGCSWAPDKPYGFNFLPACQRHDFGYRNLKKQHRFSETYKKRVDAKFLMDMYEVCDKYGNPERAFCKTQASYYYTAVSKAGS